MKNKNNKNIRRGRKSQRNGKVFDKYIERSCIRYRTLGLADIKKTPEPMKPIGVINKRKCFTSLHIHTRIFGHGYMVCPECYEKEIEAERKKYS